LGKRAVLIAERERVSLSYPLDTEFTHEREIGIIMCGRYAYHVILFHIFFSFLFLLRLLYISMTII
jgi:hypothetical protein